MILKILSFLLFVGVAVVGGWLVKLAYLSIRKFKELLLRLINNERSCRQKNTRDLRKEIDDLKKEIDGNRQEIGQIWIDIKQKEK